MKPSLFFPLGLSFYCLCCFCVFHLSSIITGESSSSIPLQWNQSDRFSLLAIKSQIKGDPLGTLSSWNATGHHCDWKGITCSLRHRERVTVLDLSSQKLEGTLSPFVGNLTFLRRIKLSDNNFYGEIPQKIGHLFRLQSFDVRNNSFSGEIPVTLTNCSNLRKVFLRNNLFSGNIFSKVSSLPKLGILTISENNFTGYVSSSLGNLSFLTYFSVSENHFGGVIPGDLCRIANLSYIDVASNNLTGEIPSCLYNQSKIYIFSVGMNQLQGSLPPDMGLTLPEIQGIYFIQNKFTGHIPVSLSNATKLNLVDLMSNFFTGSVPPHLGRLENIQRLNFHSNQLGTETGDDLEFINSLTNCSNLESLALGQNLFKGPLPDAIANLSTNLTFLDARENRIYGHIPEGIGNLASLDRLFLHGNKLSGQIPSSLGRLTRLTTLILADNNLSGKIPHALGDCKNLLRLNLSRNNLTGEIPAQLFAPNLQTIGLDFRHNALSGPLPSQIGNLTKLVDLYVSGNKLSGHLPESLGNCLSLEILLIDNNFLSGEIPKSFSSLRGLNYIDISHNNLSGEIPVYFEQLPILYLDFSFNDFEGEVPKNGVFQNKSLFSVVGNINLCGGVVELELRRCTRTKKKSISVKVIIPVIVGSICFLVASCLFLMVCRRKISKRKSSSTALLNPLYDRVSYSELSQATNEFAEENLIGVGSYGTVYKGNLEKINKMVAVKVFKLHTRGASKNFLNECHALRNIRHRNLLKVITACSSIDHQGNDFKALVLDYMPNGSLADWLYPRVDAHQVESGVLSFNQRLDIVIDVASALEYLHHQCEQRIVHCDVKPSNVLLDNDMTAHLADFGIAKMFDEVSSDLPHSQASSEAVKGTIGYVAPEYGMGGRRSMQGDVYSFGILMLEMFMGKRPTDDIFMNGLSLHRYAKMALHDEVMDQMAVLEENKIINVGEQWNARERLQGCLLSIITLGVSCSAESPGERVNMSEVVIELHRIKKRLHGVRFGAQSLLQPGLDKLL